jgi:hypothetical protein
MQLRSEGLERVNALKANLKDALLVWSLSTLQ